MSVGDVTAPRGSAPPSLLQEADEAVDLALKLADLPDDEAVMRLLEAVEFRYPVVSQGRGACLALLRARPSNARDLLRVLDLFAIALDHLEVKP